MRVVSRINTSLIDGIIGLGDELEQISLHEAQTVYDEYIPRIQADLEYEPEPPSYPYGEFDWVSDRQRIKVITLLTQAAIARGDYTIGPRGGIHVTDLRYQRDHTLAQGWQVEVHFDGPRSVLSISNPAAPAKFVYGTLNMRSLAEAAIPQQPFHAGRWPLIAQRIRDWYDLIEQDYRDRMATAFGNAVRVVAQRRSFR